MKGFRPVRLALLAGYLVILVWSIYGLFTGANGFVWILIVFGALGVALWVFNTRSQLRAVRKTEPRE